MDVEIGIARQHPRQECIERRGGRSAIGGDERGIDHAGVVQIEQGAERAAGRAHREAREGRNARGWDRCASRRGAAVNVRNRSRTEQVRPDDVDLHRTQNVVDGNRSETGARRRVRRDLLRPGQVAAEDDDVGVGARGGQG